MGLKARLLEHKIPLPDDFDTRMDVLISGLRRSPDYANKAATFALQKGGGGEDWLGPKLTGVIDGLTTPAARTILQSLFMVVFFIKYLENIPVFGSILSATLDVMIMGGKMLVKSVQKALPPLMGLLPLPYASAVGLGMAATFGLLVWPILALVSFSRADFTAAIDSYLRILPPPMGDMIADTFLEADRTVFRLNEKRQQLGNDISDAFAVLSGSVEEFKQGFRDLSDKTREVSQRKGGGRKKLTRQHRRKNKGRWQKTRRNK
jgi:hypothetical protein